MTDLLLEWMSFRGAGRTDDVPSDLTAGSSPHRVVGDLAMLGHLEPLGTTSWRIAPPVLAGLPSQDGGSSRAVLCGARTSGVLASLTAACQTASVEMTVTPIPGRPTSLRVTAPSKAALASVAAAARLAFQHDAAFTLLACTPLIRNWPRTPCAMVAGRVETVRRFSRSKVGWVEFNSGGSDGRQDRLLPDQAGLGLGQHPEDRRV